MAWQVPTNCSISSVLAIVLGLGLVSGNNAWAQSAAAPGEAGAAYHDMPAIAPIGVRVDRYLPLPNATAVPPVDPAKGYRLQQLGHGLYMVTDNGYQSMFLVYDKGVVVMDAPPSYSAHLKQAIAEVTDRPITHLIYSHAHIDHIGGAADLGGHPIIIAQEETKRLLVRANDPKRPVPTITFKDRYTLKVGSQVLELSYHGVAHEPGNIFIWAPAQKVLMVVDMVFPGWMAWSGFADAQDIPGYFEQVAEIDKIPFETLVGGHVDRVGTHADVREQLAFMNDVKSATRTALQTTPPFVGMADADKANAWAVADNYIDRVVVKCVNAVTPKWQSRLAAYDVFIWSQCFAMQQSLRID
ncbi:glyoxylase-like metal-dependent hydrolase (beta-lactamase superfamily II) [Bradyrhizobium macuxiense]|uniref:Glyoxylase-like metal-dependent hydrolase (Beta-lactamase superfamily II) n=1 Tax=Bradyrhizobium macuxiense TaxID=1755647 RepID=A0A560MIP7_9BRAD|nr:MBL fold metallo-hydrolase [Bradyrhizobium macuxiense]TWC07245.1 glyoxylase-like metal-dependent hydrolase (beta-lactamase superfamily II) [Bradyrhizobium macuxiense]